MPRLTRQVSQLAVAVGPIPAITLAVLLWWSADGGGFSLGSWGLAGIGLVALLAVAIIASPPRLATFGPAQLTALGALCAFVAWNFLSLLWADFPSDAWKAADTTLLYAVVFALFAMWRWEPRAVMTVLGIYAITVGAIGTVLIVQASTSHHPASFFQDGRPLPPIGYVNANVALWMMAFWPAAFLASVRTVPIPLRGLFLACASLLLQLSLIGESRGWLFLMPVIAPLALLLARQRLRLILATGICTVAALAILQPLLHVFETADSHRAIGPPLDHAARLMLITCLAVGAAGLAWGVLDRVVVVPRRLHAAAAVAVALACAAGVVAGAVRLAQSIDGHPKSWVDQHWSDFTRGYPNSSGGSRFTGSLGTDRYLQWKVAVLEFRDHPLIGVGADNYLADYLLHRKTDFVDPRFPHSTPLRLLSQLGIVGAALFALFAGSAILLGLRNRRRLDPVSGGAVGACLTIFVYWFIHGSTDWFWEIPALAAPAFGFLGLAVGATSERSAERGRDATTRSRPLRLLAIGSCVALLGAIFVSLALPWLSYRYEIAGLAIWTRAPTTAYSRLERAASLNPLTGEPYVIEGSIALRRGDLVRARVAFNKAIDREPRGWYPYFQLALAAGSERDFATAARYLRLARALNPADTVIARVAEIIRVRGAIHPESINALYLKELNRRLTGNPKL